MATPSYLYNTPSYVYNIKQGSEPTAKDITEASPHFIFFNLVRSFSLEVREEREGEVIELRRRSSQTIVEAINSLNLNSTTLFLKEKLLRITTLVAENEVFREAVFDLTDQVSFNYIAVFDDLENSFASYAARFVKNSRCVEKTAQGSYNLILAPDSVDNYQFLDEEQIVNLLLLNKWLSALYLYLLSREIYLISYE